MVSFNPLLPPLRVTIAEVKMQTAYPNLIALLSRKTNKAVDKLAAQDPNVADALALLDRDVPALKQVKGFSARCERTFKQAIKSKEAFEDLADFLAEVQVAELFLEADLLREFEPPLPVPVQAGKKPPDCDLLAVVNGEKVWVEVKRIRRTLTEVTLEKQVAQIARIEKEIGKVSAPFVVILDLRSQLGPQDADRIVEKITRALVEAFEELKTRPPLWPLRKPRVRLEDEKGKELGSFDIHEKKRQLFQEETTTVLRRIPYSDNGSERRKFRGDLDKKGAKLDNLPEGEAGFIFFWVDSDTHEEIDLLGGLLDLSDIYQTRDNPEIKAQWEIEQFFNTYKKVTGVILRAEYLIASVTSPGAVSWGSGDRKRYKIHWNPWAENKLSDATATMLAELFG